MNTVIVFAALGISCYFGMKVIWFCINLYNFVRAYKIVSAVLATGIGGFAIGNKTDFTSFFKNDILEVFTNEKPKPIVATTKIATEQQQPVKKKLEIPSTPFVLPQGRASMAGNDKTILHLP